MKTLLLMRHAKSSWKDEKLKDRERPLTKRGLRNAPQMGELIKERELVPQLILTSPAARAQETARLVAEASGYTGEIRVSDNLYMAEAEEIMAEVRHVPDEIDRVLVIGHNPGMESLLPLLAHEIKSLPTAALACLRLDLLRWKDFGSQTESELLGLWKPKELDHEKEKEEETDSGGHKDGG